MTPAEKVAYLKGLTEGLGVDKDSKEGKLFAVITDILGDLALDVEALEEAVADLDEDLEALSDEMEEIEDFLDEDCKDEDCCCGHHHDEDDEEPVFYEVTCPNCDNTITVDEDVLLLEKISCPNCGETLEFEFDEIEGETETEEN